NEHIAEPLPPVPAIKISNKPWPGLHQHRDDHNQKQRASDKRENVDQLQYSKANGSSFCPQAGKGNNSQGIGYQNERKIDEVSTVVCIIYAVIEPGGYAGCKREHETQEQHQCKTDHDEAVVKHARFVAVILLEVAEISGFHAKRQYRV